MFLLIMNLTGCEKTIDEEQSYQIRSFPKETLTYNIGDVLIQAREIDEELYLFLPSSEHPSDFTISCELMKGEELRIKGDLIREAVSLDADLHTVTTPADQKWPIELSIWKNNTLIASQTMNVMYSANISSMFISSEDSDQAGRQYVDEARFNKISGSMIMNDSDGECIYRGSYEEIKVRGNSSYKYYPKKSYQIKLGKGASLIDGTAKHKTWILLAQYSDPLKIADKTWKDVMNYLDPLYEPATSYIDLYWDGEYRGTYLVSEKIQVAPGRINILDYEEIYEKLNPNYGQTPVINVAKNKYHKSYKYTEGLIEPEQTSFIVEMNGPAGDEPNWFKLKSDLGFNIKFPEYVGIKGGKYISEYVQEFENAIMATDENGNHTGQNPDTGLYYYEYVDLESLVRIYILNSVSSYRDGFWRSLYMYKDTEGIMVIGPVWDMDLTLGTGWLYEPSVQNEPMQFTTWGNHLIQIPSFRQKLKEYYQEYFATVIDALHGDGSAIEKTGLESLNQRFETVKASIYMDQIIWPDLLRNGSPFAKYPNQTYAEYLEAGKVPKFDYWEDGTTLEQIAEIRFAWQLEHDNWLKSYYGNLDAVDFQVEESVIQRN